MFKELQKKFDTRTVGEVNEEVKETHPISDICSDFDKATILEFLGNKRYTTGLEIGSFIGYSANFFLDTCCDNLICIDSWQQFVGKIKYWAAYRVAGNGNNVLATFLDNIKDRKDQVLAIRAHSISGLYKVHRENIKPDFIYIDGGHDYFTVYWDIRTALELFPESKILGHDITGESVANAVNQIAEEFNKKVITKADTEFKAKKNLTSGIWTFE